MAPELSSSEPRFHANYRPLAEPIAVSGASASSELEPFRSTSIEIAKNSTNRSLYAEAVAERDESGSSWWATPIYSRILKI